MNRCKYIYIIFILLIVLSFQGCKKNSSTTIYIPKQLKDYSVFKEGSYWIFLNENTGVIDSMYIQNPPSFTYSRNGDGPIIEKCNTYYGGSLLASSYAIWSEFGVTMQNDISNFCLMSESFQPGYTVDLQDLYFKNINYFDTLKINNNICTSVMNTYCRTITLNKDTAIYSFYLSKFIGFVKINLHRHNADTTWSIIRYHVIQ